MKTDYEYDIFVSYRRSDDDWVRGTKENFMRAVSSLLRPSIGKYIRVFVDEDIETGTAWPNKLANALSKSKLLVPILSRDYFQSNWCRLELALMLEREKKCGLRCADCPEGLVVPVVIDDGDCFPDPIKAIQASHIHQYANPFMRNDSPNFEKFADELKSKFCKDIETAMANVPLFDPEWSAISHEQFEAVFKIDIESQSTVPSLNLGAN